MEDHRIAPGEGGTAHAGEGGKRGVIPAAHDGDAARSILADLKPRSDLVFPIRWYMAWIWLQPDFTTRIRTHIFSRGSKGSLMK